MPYEEVSRCQNRIRIHNLISTLGVALLSIMSAAAQIALRIAHPSGQKSTAGPREMMKTASALTAGHAARDSRRVRHGGGRGRRAAQNCKPAMVYEK